MLKKNYIILFVLFLTNILNHNVYSKNIAIIYNKNSSNYQHLVDVFENSLTKNNHKLTFVDVKNKNINRILLRKKSEYLFTIGTKASKIAKQTTLPGIFCYVIFPAKVGLIDSSSIPTNQKLYGISCNVDYNYSFKILKQLIPDPIDIGVIFNPSKTGKRVGKLEDICNKNGDKLLKVPINDSKEALSQFNKILKKIDLLYLVLDNSVLTPTNIKFFMQTALIYKKTIVGLSEKMTRNGALISFFINMESLGEQAASLMEKLIDNKIDFSLPIENPKNANFKINKEIAKILRIDISKIDKENIY